jgi:uncharacterized low-complexity protein
MSKFRKLVVTVGALAVLAVGGAAFAQAQNSSAVTPTQQSTGESTSPGDPADGQAGDHDQGRSDQGNRPGDQADGTDAHDQEVQG